MQPALSDLASKAANGACREFSGRGLLGWARATLQLRLMELEREKTGKAILSVEPMGGQVCLVQLLRYLSCHAGLVATLEHQLQIFSNCS